MPAHDIVRCIWFWHLQHTAFSHSCRCTNMVHRSMRDPHPGFLRLYPQRSKFLFCSRCTITPDFDAWNDALYCLSACAAVPVDRWGMLGPLLRRAHGREGERLEAREGSRGPILWCPLLLRATVLCGDKSRVRASTGDTPLMPHRACFHV